MAIHILTECPRFLEDRRAKLSNRIVDTMALKDIRLMKFIEFSKYTGLWPVLTEANENPPRRANVQNQN